MAAVDYFLKIEGIDGESQDAKHKGSLQIETYNFGASQAGAHAGGGGSGKARLQDFSFVMLANKAPPKLFLACCNGEHLKKAVLTCRKAGKEQQEYLKVTLTDLLISSFQSGGPHKGELLPFDSVSLNFAKIEIEYREQKADGSLAGAIKSGWDLKGNKAV
jgi:type VI secretion system secreted protein Hcp